MGNQPPFPQSVECEAFRCFSCDQLDHVKVAQFFGGAAVCLKAKVHA